MNDWIRPIGTGIGAGIGWMSINSWLAGLASIGSLILFGLAIYDRFWGRKREPDPPQSTIPNRRRMSR